MTTSHRRQRSLFRLLLQTSRRDTPVQVAARDTAAVILPLIVGALAGHLMIGLGVATGALTTMFADQPGPYRLRLRRMLLIAAVAGCAAFCGAVLSQWPVALVVVVTVWCFGAALLVALGPHATRVGLTSVILLVIMTTEPLPVSKALPAGLLVFAGGALQTLFAISAWPLNRYRPERQALTVAFRGLAAFAGAPPAPAAARIFPPSLNDLQTLVFGSGRARGRAAEAFRVLAELTERIRIELFALADQRLQHQQAVPADAMASAAKAAAAVLAGIADSLEQAAAPRVGPALKRYVEAIAFAGTDDALSHTPALSACLTALGGQLRSAARTAALASSRGEMEAETAQLQLPKALRPANPVATIRASLRRSSPAFRHAVRCSGCVGVAMALAQGLALPHGYWMPMTAAIVLKADFAATWRYTILRVAGTLGGLVLTTAVLHVAGAGNLWTILAVMAALCFAFRELAVVQYGLAVVCLTGVVVILLELYGVPAGLSMTARAIGTIAGSGLALFAYFLWPTWERGRERVALARLLDAYADYLDAVLRGEEAACYPTRVDARAARGAAQASLDRLAAEPASRASLPRAAVLVAQANRVVRAAMLLEAAGIGGRRPSGLKVKDFAAACDAALRESGGALREARPPRGGFMLRRRRREMLASVPAAHAAYASILDETTDSIVDATHSVLHVLGMPRDAMD